MAYPGEARKSRLVEELAKRARKAVAKSKGAQAERFVQAFYANVPPDDMLSMPEDSRLGVALSAWQALQSRKRRQPTIRIFNPDSKKDLWSSPHTVIQIVNDDMPFLVDSVTNELNRHKLTVHLLIHPVVAIRRDQKGRLLDLCEPGAGAGDLSNESIMHIEINEQSLPETLSSIEAGIGQVLGDVRAAVEGWRTMRVGIADIIAELDTVSPPSIPRDELDEARAFLRWIDDNHFIFLGFREYTFDSRRGKMTLNVVPKSGRGLLRNDNDTVFEGIQDGNVLPPEIADFIRKPRLLMVSKANRQSPVHRAVHMDTIGVKRFDEAGNVIGERLFVGLFTSAAYNRATRDIPMLRRKVDGIIARSGLAASSHDGKALLNILETLPRDELLQTEESALYDTAMGILHLQERQRVALFVHRDPFCRFASCLVYVPRDRFTTALRHKLQNILSNGLAGPVTAHYAHVSESPLARLHFIVKTEIGAKPPMSDEQIERLLIEAARDWNDDVGHALTAAHGETRGVALLRIVGNAFPAAYREQFDPETAVNDIAKIETVLRLGLPATDLYHRAGEAKHEVRFKMFNREEPVPLSDVLPVLENMGLRVVDEVPHEIVTAGAQGRIWIHDFGMYTRSRAPIDLKEVKEKFEDAVASVWEGDTENDGFNHLVIGAALTFRQIAILRAYCKYLRQAAIPFSQDYMEDTLDDHPKIARMLVELFEAKFDPALEKDRTVRTGRVRGQITRALDSVENLDQDRILRRYLNIIESTTRTNYFQRADNGGPKPYLSLKIDSQSVDDLPLPKPMREIFVYSPRVEAVHLRGGKVARGGIRWSDRREDFRTEILGLMKAQMTKNAVIVPVGAKGGFVVKRAPVGGDREAQQAEGIACYTMMMRGLLDITDNLSVSGALKKPGDTVCHDDDDPYLVVAADKGTATFSDIANGIARDYGFWLDDAFASGGSVGYDHKKMAITARGAWESVKRHLREMGINSQADDFTVVGIGDMGGDVFGNGMLLSNHINLVGAFNHMHI
ncbi:MAG: NAD-glutamate dehydrogenase domain-containing protein, partial [Alphaproteobacteria bacterium]